MGVCHPVWEVAAGAGIRGSWVVAASPGAGDVLGEAPCIGRAQSTGQAGRQGAEVML